MRVSLLASASNLPHISKRSTPAAPAPTPTPKANEAPSHNCGQSANRLHRGYTICAASAQAA
ncbi:hypothetical protein BTUL_0176g00080 [Botrytis tulipae]|uniref:Uncharacterized protein n=1 Tax=Botrytis tulipae TaxID=87230 RepID=A0A4Z1EAG4_9HELO|nr:hypothetical protein BTUL_0176g00080 [Botrytis tulipae]